MFSQELDLESFFAPEVPEATETETLTAEQADMIVGILSDEANFVHPEVLELDMLYSQLVDLRRAEDAVAAFDEDASEEQLSIMKAQLSRHFSEEVFLKAGGKKGILTRAKEAGSNLIARILEVLKKLYMKLFDTVTKRLAKTKKLNASIESISGVIEVGDVIADTPSLRSKDMKSFSVPGVTTIVGGGAKGWEAAIKEVETFNQKMAGMDEVFNLVGSLGDLAGMCFVWHGFNKEQHFLAGHHQNNALMVASNGNVEEGKLTTFKIVDESARQSKNSSIAVELGNVAMSDIKALGSELEKALGEMLSYRDTFNKIKLNKFSKKENENLIASLLNLIATGLKYETRTLSDATLLFSKLAAAAIKTK